MPWFMTRVVLHNAGREDYEELHQYMDDAGFTKVIEGEKAIYDLPDAMYDYRTDDETVQTSDVRDKAVAAANKTKKKNSVFVVRYVAWSSMSLTRTTP